MAQRLYRQQGAARVDQLAAMTARDAFVHYQHEESGTTG
jgi:hypothetical protein